MLQMWNRYLQKVIILLYIAYRTSYLSNAFDFCKALTFTLFSTLYFLINIKNNYTKKNCLAISVSRENNYQHIVIYPPSLFFYTFIIICCPLTFHFGSLYIHWITFVLHMWIHLTPVSSNL